MGLREGLVTQKGNLDLMTFFLWEFRDCARLRSVVGYEPGPLTPQADRALFAPHQMATPKKKKKKKEIARRCLNRQGRARGGLVARVQQFKPTHHFLAAKVRVMVRREPVNTEVN